MTTIKEIEAKVTELQDKFGMSEHDARAVVESVFNMMGKNTHHTATITAIKEKVDKLDGKTVFVYEGGKDKLISKNAVLALLDTNLGV